MVASALTVAALLLAPPGDQPPVQRPTPKVSPTQPDPGEPAIAPAHVESEAATAEPALVEPAPVANEPQPIASEPEPGAEATEPAETPAEPGGLPSWQSQPAVEGPQPSEQASVDEWGLPVTPPPKRYPPKGGGLYAGAGALFGVMITKQWITAIICEDVYCGWRGNFDRVLGLGVMGLAAGGGVLDGRRSAYIAREDNQPPKPLTARRATGWSLFALGFGGLLTDAILYNLCYQNALGPYTQQQGFSYTCSPVASVVVTDLSTALGGVGIGLGMSAESYLRNHREPTLSLVPWGGQGRAGLSLSGRF